MFLLRPVNFTGLNLYGNKKTSCKKKNSCYNILYKLFRDSSTVEHSAVNRRVEGSNPFRGAILFFESS